MKKFSVLSLVFVLFAVSSVVAQEEQASPSDAPVVTTETVQEAATAVQEPVATDQSVIMMPVEGQAAAPMVSNGCCGSVVQQPCCGQAQPACGCAPTCRRMVRRPFFRRGWFRRGCCN